MSTLNEIVSQVESAVSYAAVLAPTDASDPLLSREQIASYRKRFGSLIVECEPQEAMERVKGLAGRLTDRLPKKLFPFLWWYALEEANITNGVVQIKHGQDFHMLRSYVDSSSNIRLEDWPKKYGVELATSGYVISVLGTGRFQIYQDYLTWRHKCLRLFEDLSEKDRKNVRAFVLRKAVSIDLKVYSQAKSKTAVRFYSKNVRFEPDRRTRRRSAEVPEEGFNFKELFKLEEALAKHALRAIRLSTNGRRMVK